MTSDQAIELVRRLRAQADSTTFPAEAASCRAKADQLMAAHRITETMLNQVPSPSEVVVWVTCNATNLVTMFFTGAWANTAAQPSFMFIRTGMQ